MKKEMLINVLQPEECRIAILEDGVLEELYVERTSHESYVGNIYKGRIVNIEPSIQAAFVDFGVGRNGFLHVSDVEPAYYRHLEQRRGEVRGRDRDRTGDRDRGRDDRGRGRDERGRDERGRDERGRDRDRDREHRRPEPVDAREPVYVEQGDVEEEFGLPALPVEVTADVEGIDEMIEAEAELVEATLPAGDPEFDEEVPAETQEAVEEEIPLETQVVQTEEARVEFTTPVEVQSTPQTEEAPVAEAVTEEAPVAEEATPRRRTRRTTRKPAEEKTEAKPVRKRTTRSRKKDTTEAKPDEETPGPELMESAERRTEDDDESAAGEFNDNPGGVPIDDADLFFPRATPRKPVEKIVEPPVIAAEPEPEPEPTPEVSTEHYRPDPRMRKGARRGSIERALEEDIRALEAEGGEGEAQPTPRPAPRAPEPRSEPRSEPRREPRREPTPTPMPRRELAPAAVEVEADEDFGPAPGFDDDFGEEDFSRPGRDEGPRGGGERRGDRRDGGRGGERGGDRRGGDRRGDRRGNDRGGDRRGGPGGGRPGMSRPKPLIQDIFKRGQEVLVQVIKEGVGTKGPTLSTYISIAGRYLVLMPGLNRVGVSRKIADEEQRRRLRDIFNELKPPKGLGFIIRTAGVDRNKKELQRDLIYLSRLWQVVVRRLRKIKSPAEIYQESDMITRTIRDNFTGDIDTIWVDEPTAFEHAQEFLQIVMPRYANRIKLFAGKEPLYHKYGIEEEIHRIQLKKVPLLNGGSIVIEQTEALVAIDVNSGNYRAESQNAEETAYQMNLLAAKEIGRQLRLRDLGGVIVNDFIDMRDEKHRRGVEKALRDALRRDRARTKVLRMSAFGIIEMTRQRIRPSLRRSIYEDCTHCKGHAQVKTTESVSIEAMRLLQLAAHKENVEHVEIRVTQAVGNYLLNRKRKEMAKLEEEGKITVQITGVPHAPPELMDFLCYDVTGNEVRLQPVEEPRPRRR